MALISALQLLSFFGAALTGRKFGTPLMLETLPSSESPLPSAAALAAARTAALAASLCRCLRLSVAISTKSLRRGPSHASALGTSSEPDTSSKESVQVAACGYNGANYWVTAELYNPATGLWSFTGSLNTGRYQFQMVLLPNSSVLAAGGSAPNVLKDAELYNPATGMWTSTGPLNTARQLFQMLTLPNGNVLAAGGQGTAGATAPLSSVEVYNSATGIWGFTGSLTIARVNFEMLLLNDIVLAIGGYNGGTLASVETYNSTMGMWNFTGSLNTARYNIITVEQ
ncbi:g6824 [Coccomyxa elongata]